jgi:Protein of unknown function (DUF3309)
MSISSVLLLVVLITLLVAVYPSWRHSYEWGYKPAAVIAALILLAMCTAE